MLHLDGNRFDHFPSRRVHLRGRPQPCLAEDGSDLRLCLGIAREDPYQLRPQPLEIGRQQFARLKGGFGPLKMWVSTTPC